MILSANSITKIYGKGQSAFVALDRVSLSIKRGESVAILGKSGSGKSTLMHVLAALDRVNGGTIECNGKDYDTLSAGQLDALRSKHFGFIFQQFFLNGRETVLENVLLPLKIAGIGFGARKKRAIAALKAVDLLDKKDNRATDLSGGQKQRVAIARALVNDPEVIFADEPTGNLDSENGARIEELLFDLNRKKGITLIVVTHDDELANKCDRRLEMKDGQLKEATKK